jgi:phosphotransferase system HPr (HPr) family protein
VPKNSERRVALPPDVALHARPAAEFVKLAMGFSDAKIELINGKREADGKSLMAVLALGATGGSELLLRARGGDAGNAVEALASYVAKLH